MRDLFTLDRQFEPIPMPDADVSMLHEVEMPLPYEVMLRKLMEQTIWRQESMARNISSRDWWRSMAMQGCGMIIQGLAFILCRGPIFSGK
jgi:hypothetical protein